MMEMQSWVAAWGKELQVDGEKEGETKESNDNKKDKSDS